MTHLQHKYHKKLSIDIEEEKRVKWSYRNTEDINIDVDSKYGSLDDIIRGIKEEEGSTQGLDEKFTFMIASILTIMVAKMTLWLQIGFRSQFDQG